MCHWLIKTMPVILRHVILSKYRLSKTICFAGTKEVKKHWRGFPYQSGNSLQMFHLLNVTHAYLIILNIKIGMRGAL